MLDKVTFERVCGWYLLASMAMALLVPSSFSIESHLPVPVERIPFASYISRIPGHLNSASLYFTIMWLMLPIVVVAFALKPQQKNDALEGSAASAARALLATIVALLIAALVGSSFYLNISSFEPSSRGIALLVLMARYRLGLGAIGGILMLTTALSVYMVLVQVPRIWHSYFFANPMNR